MQQYFIDQKLDTGAVIELNADILYHLKKVLRKNSGYKFRMVDSYNKCFLLELKDNNAVVLEELIDYNELNCKVTAIVSLIKIDHFELCIQKLTELGVSRIVPYKAIRSNFNIDRFDKKIERFKKIAQEASEQCERNIIPEIDYPISLKNIPDYLSDINLLAYEREDSSIKYLLNNNVKSLTFIIGPEGGFDEEELSFLKETGFSSISLGKRILRAETAAIYLMSLCAEAFR